MTTYAFKDIDPNHTLMIEGTDVVTFSGGPARLASVTYNPLTVEGATITVTFLDHSATFDFGLVNTAANLNLRFDDGSHLLIGNPREESFEGAAGDDALFGGDGADTLNGHDGANFLQGNQGADSLASGIGADTILGGRGDDIINTSVGDDGLHEAGDFVNGNLGNDTVSGSFGADTLLGGQGDDNLFGESGRDFINGNLGDDHITADGPATLFGEDGGDTLTARGDGAVLNGGAGADRFGLFMGGLTGFGGVRATIADWSAEDSISFSHVAAGHAYAESQAADLGGALAEATRLSAAAADPDGAVVVVQVGQDLYAFATPLGGAAPTAAVLIVGRTLADIGADDFIT